MSGVRTALAGMIVAGAAALSAPAQEYHVPQVRLPLMKQAPEIDGTVNEKDWAGAARMEGFGAGPTLKPAQASFWVGCDGKELFIAVVSETPPGGRILARVNPAPENGNARTWLDDSIEMVLDPLHSDATARRRLYHANINAKGAINDSAYAVGGGGETWRGGWRMANKILGDRWHFECALPLKDMLVTPADLAKPFGIRICRNWQQSLGPGQTEWGPKGGAFLAPETLPLVTWDAAAPVVQTLQIQDAGKPNVHLKVSVFNPQAQPLELKAILKCFPKNSAHKEESSDLTLAAGETKILDLEASALNEEVYTLIQVSSKDAKTLYYLRDFNWNPTPPAATWTLDENAVKKVEVEFAYYPSFDKARLRVNVGNLQERHLLKGLHVRIQPKGGKALAEADMPPLKDDISNLEWPLPKLGEGEYELLVEPQGLKMDPVRVAFVRYVFPWEGNALGKSDVVTPPFTPIQVDGRKVRTVLRQHTLNSLGLWQQVVSLQRPLLRSPMRLEVTVAGKTRPVEAQDFAFTEKKDTRAVSQARLAGPLTGTVRSVWDYDGLMKWTLDLQPSKEKIEKLALAIPLDNALMPLFHACTDGLRFNYAGLTPAGEGKVWDGTKAVRNSIIGNYVPYIWLGAEERGFCVFGENDSGWVTDAQAPCQEIVRRGDTLEVRLNLIARETVIGQPRRIVIGFEATPVKPLPQDWRRWTMSVERPDTRNLSFNGSCWTWGALTPCCDVYPRDEDFSLWEEFKKTRETGVINEDFKRKWIAGYGAKTDEEKKLVANNMNYVFNQLKGKPQRVLIYTNARGVRFDTREGQTFLNEWDRDLFPKRQWTTKGDGVAYDLNPCASFRDYAMWHYKKMYDTFADAIYWDDIFMQSAFHPVGTEAYERPDGTIQPAAGLWDMRELIRRTAVLCSELGKPNANMPHITNTNLVPVLAFAGTHYTWEDKAGPQDFQDRFTRDYLRAESIGLQCGNVPFGMLLLQGVADKEKMAWIERTATGASLTHEVKLAGGPWSLPACCKVTFKLLEFGYGLPEVQVSRYWDPGHPVSVAGADTTTLVCSRPGAAMILVSDWGNGGNVSLKLDRKALGLGKQWKADDAENDLPLAVTPEGVVQFELKKHDFKLIKVETRKEN
ncbi:MAG: glycoside hydrolase domain-containing protein [Planctomycetota bacterium]